MDIEASPQQTFREDSVSQKVIDSQKIVEPAQFYDPFLVLLKVKLRLNDWWPIIGCAILVLGLPLMVAAIVPTDRLNGRAFFSPIQLLSLCADYLVLVGAYLSLPSAMADFFNRLWESGVIGDDHAETPGSPSYQEFVEKHIRLIHSRWWVAIALLAVPLTPLYFVFVHPIWIGLPVWFAVICNVFIFVGNYGAILACTWLVLIAITMHRLFRTFTIRVKPLHPDGSGGLGLFNRLLGISIPLVVIVGCSLPAFWGSTSSLFDRVLLLADIIVYLLAAVLLLRAWLILPHQAMVQARNKLLEPLTHEHERVLAETMLGAISDVAEINEGTERLVALRKRYEEVRDGFPTWPVAILQLRGMVTLLLVPILLTLLPLVLGLFTK